MRKFLIFLLILIALIGVGVFYALNNVGGIIEASIEQFGSDATQTNVAVDGVELDLAAGSAALNGLTVGNPQGYSDNNAVSLGRVDVAVDLDSIQNCGLGGCDVINLKQVNVNAPKIRLELGQGGNNLKTIQQNVEAYTQALSGGSSGASSASGTKLIIDRLTISNGQIAVSRGGSKIADVPLPTITMNDLGQSSGGAAPGEIAAAVVSRLMQSSLGAVAKAGFGDLLGTAGGIVDDAGGILKDGGEKAGDRIKGIFGR